jgi:hypothetical protein
MLALASTARARNVLSIESIVVPAGETLVEIPIDLDVDQNLTRLRFDVTFDPAFCNALQDPTDLAVTSDGRNLTDPEDVEYVCSDGVLDVDVFDDTGAIDAGMGLILVIEIGDLKVDARGSFKFTPRNILARAGTQDVPVTGAAGVLIVRSSSSTPPIDGCPSSISFDGLGCRLEALIAQVEAEVGSATLPASTLRRLVRAKRAEAKAEILCIGGRPRRTRAVLQRVARALLTFRRSLASVSSRRLADDVREALGTTAEGIASDVRVLREGLDCPATSPAGAFLDSIVPSRSSSSPRG